MKTFLLSSSVMVLAAACAPQASWANSTSAIDSIIAADNQIALDFAATHLDYLENISGTPLDSERGWVPGVDISLSALGDMGINDLYLYGHFKWVNGTSHYVGGTSIDPTYGSYVNDDGAQIFNEDIRIGKGIDAGEGTLLTPFIGAGARQWSRNLPGAGGYHEDYSFGYVGAGLMAQFALGNRVVLTANGLAGTTFSASMNTSYNGGYPITPDTYQLGSTLMLMAGVSLDYAISDHFHTNVGVDVADFGFGQSPIQPDGSLEPDSHTTDITAKIGFGYSF